MEAPDPTPEARLFFTYDGAPDAHGDDIWSAPPHCSTWYIFAGGAEVRRPGGRCWRAGPGEALVLPRLWRRHQRFASGVRLRSVAFDLRWPGGGPAFALDGPVLLPPAAAAPLAALAAPLAAAPAGPVAALRRAAAQAAYAAAWLEALLAAGARLRPRQAFEARLARVHDAFAARPRLGPLPWSGLKALTGLSRSQLDRLCRAETGAPLRALRDRLALERVRQLLADPARSVAGIAAELGAVDASHLVKWFRRLTGGTPGRARGGV